MTYATFEDYFPQLMALVETHYPRTLPPVLRDHLAALVAYTVPGGKMNRGKAVHATLSHLRQAAGQTLSPAETEQAYLLGWCIEMLQACFLVEDDIMDASVTRRGQPCWYKKAGLMAINDGMVLERLVFLLLRRGFADHPAYVDLVHLFQDVTWKTELGQALDLHMSPTEGGDLGRFNADVYTWIVQYKTAYYSFYLPVACGMYLAGVATADALKTAETVLVRIGILFQVQDDVLDCYGAPDVIGKIGTDIADFKCSWLVNQALRLASPAQRAVLEAHYGGKGAESERLVKQVFADLQLRDRFRAWEDAEYAAIQADIRAADCAEVPAVVYASFLDKIYRREK